MRQLMEQLSVLLIKNSEQKTSDISINHIVSSKNSHRILDSGAIDHMIGNENLLVNFNKYNTKQYVTDANGERMKILGDGSIKVFQK
jgi:hypothetical protein